MMHTVRHGIHALFLFLSLLFSNTQLSAQALPTRYPTLELFTNTPCPICASQNPGLFSRLQNYEGQYHLIGFYPGKPYVSCIFYTANKPENDARWDHYLGEIFGTPTVAINGIDFKTSNGVTNSVLDDITGGTSWLEVIVDETQGSSRTVDITLQDHAGGSPTTGTLFAVVVEKVIQYVAPNGETVHYNVFRKFLTPTDGVVIDLSAGVATASYTYDLDPTWQADEIYAIAWLMNPDTKEIYNSGTRFDPDFVSAVDPLTDAETLHIYPNPASTKFTISLTENYTPSNVTVHSVAGALVFEKEFAADADIHIDGSLWAEGNYVVTVKTGDQQKSHWVRIVK